MNINKLKANKLYLLILVVAAIVTVTLIVSIALVIPNYQLAPVDKNSEEEIIFTVNPGDTPEVIIINLEEENLIKSPEATYNYVIQNEYQFYPNSYLLSPSMSSKEIMDILSNPTSNIETGETLLVTEGDNIENIATKVEIATNYQYSYDEIINLWNDEKFLEELISEYWFLTEEILNPDIIYPLEGYFGSATYIIYDFQTLEDITRMMLDAMGRMLEPYQEIEHFYGFTIHEMLTMASIIERETITADDKYIVSGVFYNRLDIDMPLQSDITVLYALGEHKEIVTYADLEVESPYNTYMYSGLPPGPISTSSRESIDAAYYPSEHDYLYFFALQDTGEVLYSETYEEHLIISEENAWN